MAEPLTECLRRGVSVQLTERRQQAFDKLKQLLITAPVLSMPNDDGDYVLDVDASNTGAGAVLQQYQDCKLHVIEYASRTFNKAERQYCVTRKEMSALIFGLKQFKTYLLGKHFLVRVDHMAITYYRQTKEPVGQQARFLDFMAQFDFDVKYREGSRHVNADCLSRLKPCEVNNGEPCRQCNRRVTGKHERDDMVRAVQTRAQRKNDNSQSEMQQIGHPIIAVGAPSSRTAQQQDVTVAPPVAVKQHTIEKPKCRKNSKVTGIFSHTAPKAAAAGAADWTPAYLAEQQALDPDIGPAIAWLAEGGERPPWNAVKPTSPALRALWQQYESLVMRQGVIHRIFPNFDGSVLYYQLVLPNSLKTSFLEMIHADTAGHLKMAKCVDRVQKRAWWYTWRRDLKLFIQCCKVCNKYFRGAAPKQGKLHPMVLGGAGERWAIDLTGPHPMSNGYKFIFTAIDPFTKYAVVVPIRNKEAANVAKVIVDHILLKWGLCFEILTDQGLEFEASLTKELLRHLGIVKLRTSGYNPSTDGVCEVFH